jgi:hypothetical protein
MQPRKPILGMHPPFKQSKRTVKENVGDDAISASQKKLT